MKQTILRAIKNTVEIAINGAVITATIATGLAVVIIGGAASAALGEVVYATIKTALGS